MVVGGKIYAGNYIVVAYSSVSINFHWKTEKKGLTEDVKVRKEKEYVDAYEHCTYCI